MSLSSRSRVLRLLTPVVLLPILALGCGDLYSDPTPTVRREARSPSPSETGGSVSPKPLTPHFEQVGPPCPPLAVEGTRCETTGSVCEYGASPDMHCNAVLACIPEVGTGGTGVGVWTARPSVLCPSYACPAETESIAAIDGMPCTLPAEDAGSAPPTDADELMCPLADGVCACTTGRDAAHAHPRRWVCVKPGAGCPPNRPLVGSQCEETRTCDYGACELKRGLRMDCFQMTSRTKAVTCN